MGVPTLPGVILGGIVAAFLLGKVYKRARKACKSLDEAASQVRDHVLAALDDIRRDPRWQPDKCATFGHVLSSLSA